MAANRIGIIGNGNVGSALARGLKRAGRDDDPIRATAEIDVDDHRDFPGDSPRWDEPPAHSGYQVFRPTR
jgi:homoserine dehydrogenase